MRARGITAAAVATIVLIVGAVFPAHAAEPSREAASPADLLRVLHPDFAKYLRRIRVVSLQAASVSPYGIYSGLVRPGGRDPRIREDAPLSGAGVRNDVILYPDAVDPSRGTAWMMLILDHEYFHARHLAGKAGVPLVDFGEAAANHSYYEAVAWSYVLRRARAGVYGPMSVPDLRETAANYQKYYARFRSFIEERQPSAWLHYGRYLPSPDLPPDPSPSH